MSASAVPDADFSIIRYAQCWEDADVLVKGLACKPGARCLSICSAGDNALALLTTGPAEVVAVDLSPAQIACLELRIAAYRTLDHEGLLELIGSRASDRRAELYRRCRERGGMSSDATAFWDSRPGDIARGIGHAGKFEAYFRLFRRWLLPLVHGRGAVRELLRAKPQDGRRSFHERVWNNRRWRWMFSLFFSRRVMGRLGRDPSFFRYVEGSVADRIMERARYALTELDPASNPYLQWILLERHATALPLALRPEHFETIRARVDRVRCRVGPIGHALDEAAGAGRFDAFNLSDIFEYMSEDGAAALLRRIAASANPDARLLYWNMLAPRSRPEEMRDVLEPLDDLSSALHREDKAFFYSRVVVERVLRSGGAG
jgi:S-adenosylmethionine-diacylglycerol 3-amino-3-carboxypropyl transferase